MTELSLMQFDMKIVEDPRLDTRAGLTRGTRSCRSSDFDTQFEPLTLRKITSRRSYVIVALVTRLDLVTPKGGRELE